MQLQARFVITANDKPLRYFYDLNSLHSYLKLGQDRTYYDLEKGHKITLHDDKVYEIRGIFTRIHKETTELGEAGVNFYGEGQPYPFNIEIVIEVDKSASILH